MKTILTIAGVVVAAAALIGGGFFAGATVAQAQIPAPAAALAGPDFSPDMDSGSGNNFAPDDPRGPGRMMGRMGWMAQYRDEMDTAIAKALGMSIDDLRQALQSGKTLEQIAQEKGLSADQLRNAMLSAYSDVLAQAVNDGKLSQTQADAILQHVKQCLSQGFEPYSGPIR